MRGAICNSWPPIELILATNLGKKSSVTDAVFSVTVTTVSSVSCAANGQTGECWCLDHSHVLWTTGKKGFSGMASFVAYYFQKISLQHNMKLLSLHSVIRKFSAEIVT